jgi:putative FmdB family regulatory protein
VPLYEYRCEKGHTFEVIQRMTDDPVSECEKCGRPVQRVFHPVAVHFKGSGFYNTDYGKKGSKAAETSSESKSEKSEKSEKKAEKTTEKKASAD